MPGIRLTHPTLRDTDYVLPLLDVPLSGPIYCHSCEREYTTKHLHLRLDTNGETIVSFEIADTLDEYNGGGLTRQNVVGNPPAIGISSTLHENEKRRNPDRIQPVHRIPGRRKKP